MAAENDNSTNLFEVDGVQYETPLYTDLTMDDWKLVYDECQVVFLDFGPLVDDPEGEKARLERLRNPRLEQSFLMIGYLRTHPDDSVDTAREVTGRARLIALFEAQNPEVPADADDPTQTSPSQPEEPSERSSDDTPSSSSPDSTESSDQPDDQPVAIGTGG